MRIGSDLVQKSLKRNKQNLKSLVFSKLNKEHTDENNDIFHQSTTSYNICMQYAVCVHNQTIYCIIELCIITHENGVFFLNNRKSLKSTIKKKNQRSNICQCYIHNNLHYWLHAMLFPNLLKFSCIYCFFFSFFFSLSLVAAPASINLGQIKLLAKLKISPNKVHSQTQQTRF